MKPGLKFLLAAALLLASGCAGLTGPLTMEVPLAKLQEALLRKFPFDSRYRELFDIRLTNPRLALQPGTNRLMTTIDASIAPAFLQKSWKGSFAVSGMPAIDSSRRAVVLTDPRMENLAIDGLSSPYASQITKAVSHFAEQLLRDAPLYSFDGKEFGHAAMLLKPTQINTSSNGLVVTFEPAR